MYIIVCIYAYVCVYACMYTCMYIYYVCVYICVSAESINTRHGGFPGGMVVKNPPANTGDTGSSPGLGRSHMPWSN